MDKRRITVTIMIKRLIIVFTALLLALYTSGLFREGQVLQHFEGAAIDRLRNRILDGYGIPFGQFCITSLYSMYMKLTLVNVIVFSMIYLPTGVYLYTFLKSVYCSSRERLKETQMKLEDITLQIAIVETKQSMRESECAEYAVQLQRESERLRAARTRVRDFIAADASLRAVLERFVAPTPDVAYQTADDPDLNNQCIVELLKDLANDKDELPVKPNDITESDPRPFDTISEKSEYSSLSGAGENNDCRIKIINVTNVYRMACLKHYIKQKRLRRANKHTLLKKKMENTRKTFENWQKSLSYAVLCTLEGQDETSEEAMGDGSKRLVSDTDSDLRTDNCDEYNPAWDFPASYGDYFQEPETSGSLEDLESQEYRDKYYGNYYEELEPLCREELESRKCEPRAAQCECRALLPLPRLLEETSSQMLAIQEINSKQDHNDPNDRIITV